jgi:hypothetical protein
MEKLEVDCFSYFGFVDYQLVFTGKLHGRK